MIKLVKRILGKHWKRNLSILAVFFLGVAFAGVEYTSTPKFCGTTCHIMDTYYTSWKAGSHKEVACVDCHIPPGATSYINAKLNGFGQVVDDWLNRTSTKPSASVSDFACTRSGCHVIGNLGKVVNEERSYKFDHAKHLDLQYKGITVHCSTCHSHVQGDQHFEVNTNACVACHLMNPPTGAGVSATAVLASVDHADPSSASPSSQPSTSPTELIAPSSCNTCHDAPAGKITYQGLTIEHSEYLRFGAQCMSCHRNATQQPEPVGNTQCISCHDFGLERFTNVEDMHRVHGEGEHKVECFSCHGLIRHGPEAQAMSLEQFNCQECHQGQHMVQRSAYQPHLGTATAVAASPATASGETSDGTAVSPMFLVHVDCTGCHIQPSSISSKPNSGATVNKAVPDACDACHRPGFGKQLVPMWQRSTHELYDGVVALMPAADAKWSDANTEAGTLVRDAQRLLDLVRVDGSWGVHNPKYTQQIIEQAREKVLKARELAGIAMP